jgi:hypothetical protein
LTNVRGPSEQSSNAPAGPAARDVSGAVFINGAINGVIRNMSHGIPDVAVFVVDLSSSNPRAAVRAVLTDSEGGFSFHNLPTNGNFAFHLSASDGFLNVFNSQPAAWRSSASFLVSPTASLDPVDVWGVPQISEFFSLLLNDDAKPVYRSNPNPTRFQGNAKITAWWEYQYAVTYTHKAEGWSEIDLAYYFPRSTDLASHLSTATDALHPFGTTELARELRAAALNTAAGKGIFEPYEKLQFEIVKYGSYVGDHSNPTDLAIALRLLKLVNTAGNQESA